MRCWWRLPLVVVALLAAGCVSVALARSGASAPSTPKARATTAALHALGSARRTHAEIVFSLPGPLPAGTVIAQGPTRPGAPGTHGGPTVSGVNVVTTLKRPAWFFYDDLAPFQQYTHPGRIALVDAATGKVSLLATQWAPVIDGRLPSFLASQAAYDSGAGRVFYRPYTSGSTASARLATRTARTAQAAPTLMNSPEGPVVAKLISQDEACAVRFTDTIPGGYYAYARTAQSRAALAWRVTQLNNLGAGMRSSTYEPSSHVSPAQFVTQQITGHGCRDVMLYLAGGGYDEQTGINVGMGLPGHDQRHQDVTVAELRSVIAAHPGVHFELVIDGAHAGGFDTLARLSNLLFVATPSGPAFTNLPEVKVGGRVIRNDTNPLHLLQLTDRLVYGIDRVVGDPAEVAQMQALGQAGKLPSPLAYVLARAMARGGGVDFASLTGAGSPPTVLIQGFTAGAPSSQNGGGTPPPPAAAPVLAGIESTTLRYAAGLPAVRVTSSLTVASPDVATVTGATVRISAGLAPAEDQLTFAAQNGITGSYIPATGVLTMTGSASVAAYQAALRSVTYADTNGSTPTTGPRTITFQVDDGRGPNNLSNVVSRTIQVDPNSPPVASNDSASTDKGTAIDIGVLANDSDPDGDALHVASVDTAGTQGAVTINPDGTIHYDPHGQFSGLQQGQTATDTFTYTASDGFHDSTPATVTVTITGVDDPPVLANVETSAVQYDAGTPGVPVTSTLTVTDPPGVTTISGARVAIANGFVSTEDGLTFAAQSGITGSYDPATGVLAMTGTASAADYQAALRSVTYADASGATPTTGPRTITFQVDDGRTPHNLSNVASRTVQVNPNPPPVAGNVAASTDKHTPINVGVLSSATDPDGDPLHVASVDTAGTKGTVSINPDGTISYDPHGQFDALHAGQTATDTFTYQVSDGFHDSNAATVTVTISGVNDQPVLANVETSAASYRAQDPGIPVTSALTVSDDDDDTLSGATAAITSGFNAAADILQFTNQNGITGSYNSATGVLTLTGSASLADYQTALRSIQFATGDGSATPAARTVSFAVTDSLGVTSNSVSREIDVTPAPQPPTATGDSYAAAGNTPLAVGTTVSGPAVTDSGTSVLANDNSPSGGALSVTGHTQPAHGSVSMNPDGTFSYTPAAGFSGTDTFTYTVTAADTGKSATGMVTITVGPVVWYVDNSQSDPGTGTAGAPFNSLAAANAAAGSGSIVFLYQGTGSYTGGATLQPGEQLLGQPAGLTVDGSTLVPAGGADPTITNSGGNGIELATGADVEGVDVSGASGAGIHALNVNTATVGADTPVSISGGADGIVVNGGAGNLNLTGVSVSGGTGHSVSIANRSGGTVTLGGAITDHGTGISLLANPGATVAFSGKLTLSTGSAPAFTATGGGTVQSTASGSTVTTSTGRAVDVENTALGAGGLTFQSVSAGTGSSGPAEGILLLNTGTAGGFTVSGTGATGSGGTLQRATAADSPDAYAGDATFETTGPVTLNDMIIQSPAGDGVGAYEVPSLTLTNNSITGAGNHGVFATMGTGSADSSPGTFDISGNTFTGEGSAALLYQSQTGGTVTGQITGNTIGAAGNSINSGSAIDGIDLWAGGNGGTVTASVTNNALTGIDQGFGINAKAQDLAGATHPSTLNLTVTGNTINDQAAATQDGMTFSSGNQLADVVCLNVANNTSTSAGTAAGNGNYDADGMSVYQLGNTSVFEIVGGPAENTPGGAPGNLVEDPSVESFLAGQNTLTGPGGPAFAGQEGSAGFTGAGSCPTPLAPHLVQAITASPRVALAVRAAAAPSAPLLASGTVAPGPHPATKANAKKVTKAQKAKKKAHGKARKKPRTPARHTREGKTRTRSGHTTPAQRRGRQRALKHARSDRVAAHRRRPGRR